MDESEFSQNVRSMNPVVSSVAPDTQAGLSSAKEEVKHQLDNNEAVARETSANKPNTLLQSSSTSYPGNSKLGRDFEKSEGGQYANIAALSFSEEHELPTNSFSLPESDSDRMDDDRMDEDEASIGLPKDIRPCVSVEENGMDCENGVARDEVPSTKSIGSTPNNAVVVGSGEDSQANEIFAPQDPLPGIDVTPHWEPIWEDDLVDRESPVDEPALLDTSHMAVVTNQPWQPFGEDPFGAEPNENYQADELVTEPSNEYERGIVEAKDLPVDETDELVGMIVGHEHTVEYPCLISSEPATHDEPQAPGARAESALSQLEQDILAKDNSALSRLEQDILAKDDSALSRLEQDILAKDVGRRSSLLPIDDTDTYRPRFLQSNTTSVLSQLERDMLAKNSARPTLTEDQTQFVMAQGAPPEPGDHLSENRLAKQQVLSHFEQRVANKAANPSTDQPTFPTISEDPSQAPRPPLVVEEVRVNPPAAPPAVRRVLINPIEDQVRVTPATEQLRMSPSVEQIRIEPSGSTTLESPTFSEHGPLFKGPSFYDDEDEEIGVHDLVVARMVHNDEVWDRPSAFAVEPSAKAKKDSSNRLWAIFFILVLLMVIIGTTIGLQAAASEQLGGIPYRETIGIRETLGLTVGEEPFMDRDGPYNRALHWITHSDPLALNPSNASLTQRFLLTYFYYATADRETGWNLGCDPPTELSETDACVLEDRFSRDFPGLTRDAYAFRWLSGAPECKWAGVECDSFGQVRRLKIRWASFIQEELPQGLAHFPFITTFDSIGTRFVGEIPSAILDSRHLVQLDLPHNSITASDALSDVFEMRSLKHLDLGDNELSGAIDSNKFAQATNLKSAKLSNNKISGPIPSTFGEIHLSQLFLTNNEITGSLPESFGRSAQSLEILLLDDNMLTGTIPSFERLPSMDWLALGYNSLTGTIPDTLFDIKTVSNVDLRNNRLTGTLGPEFARLETMYFLYLGSNLFSGEVPKELAEPPLIVLELHGNNLTGEMPKELCARRTTVASFALEDLVTDCRPGDEGQQAEIRCSCCSICCDAQGEHCLDEND